MICIIFAMGCTGNSTIENPNISVQYDISSRLDPQIPNIFHSIYTVKMTIVNNGNRTENDITIMTTLKELVTDDTRENVTYINSLKPKEVQIRIFDFENLFPERKYSQSYKVYTKL